MGKIVKKAAVTSERYVVAVPHVNGAAYAPEQVRQEEDPRFAAAPVSMNAVDDMFERVLDAQPPVQIEQQIDFETLRADAEAIVDRAAADAESVLRQAETVAIELVEQAREQAKKIEEDARAAGREQGYADGHQSAHDELAPVLATMRELIESIRTQRSAVIGAAEPELVRLAMAIAERIVHSELVTNPNIVVENVRQALTRLVTREVVTLRVNPADHDTIRQHRDAIVAASDVEHLRIVEDQRVDRGGVLVETDAGTIDSKIATQLREAKRAILSEEQIALGDEEILSSPAQAS
jgi:flagellar assembly protein FliH